MGTKAGAVWRAHDFVAGHTVLRNMANILPATRVNQAEGAVALMAPANSIRGRHFSRRGLNVPRKPVSAAKRISLVSTWGIGNNSARRAILHALNAPNSARISSSTCASAASVCEFRRQQLRNAFAADARPRATAVSSMPDFLRPPRATTAPFARREENLQCVQTVGVSVRRHIRLQAPDDFGQQRSAIRVENAWSGLGAFVCGDLKLRVRRLPVQRQRRFAAGALLRLRFVPFVRQKC